MSIGTAPTDSESAKAIKRVRKNTIESQANPRWKILFYFATDNPLSPLMVSQLKAIKDAGFQQNTDVLVYFDPMEIGVPTKLYDVNRRRRELIQTSQIGDGNDPFVRNMLEDEIAEGRIPKSLRRILCGIKRKEPTSFETLGGFIDFAIRVRPADNYILFLVGHGMIVGNDAFLPDENPVSAISLKQLAKITAKFGRKDQTSLRLLALHSCSMSSIELAYELQGTTEYLMATQGPAFVHSWPYRQVVKKILNNVKKATDAQREVDVQALVEKLYYLTLYNATDFMSAGYSADLALINVKREKVRKIDEAILSLSRMLKQNLDRKPVKDLILLAHLESQSFFEENYTDLVDFCVCLRSRCLERVTLLANFSTEQARLYVDGNDELSRACSEVSGLVDNLESLADACTRIVQMLSVVPSNDRDERFNSLVIHEDNFGWEYQFSFGLSIYFPWSEPVDAERLKPTNGEKGKSNRPLAKVLNNYKQYKFTKDLKSDSWLSFLLKYFVETQRPSISMRPKNRRLRTEHDKAEGLFISGILSQRPTPELGTRTPDVGTRTPDVGGACTCPSIKNFPTDMKRNIKLKKFSATSGALRAFLSDSEPDPVLQDE